MPSRVTSSAEAALGAVLAAAGNGLLCIRPDGIIEYSNPSASVLLGISGDLTGRHYEVIGDGPLSERIGRLLDGGRLPSVPITASVGQRHLAVGFWRTRAPRLLALSIHDATEATTRRERAEAVLNATTDGLIVLSPDEVVTYVNPAATKMLALGSSRLVGKHVSLSALLGMETPAAPAQGTVPCSDFMDCGKVDCPAYDSEDLRCWLMSGTLCEGQGQPFAKKRCRCAECDYRRANAGNFDPLAPDEYSQVELEHGDKRLIIQVRVRAIVSDAGEYVGRVVALRDITSEYEVTQMKNEFVSTVSHELRTPLTSIKGYVDLILDGDAGEINELQNEFLSIVKENSDRLVELINEMLDISRIESGRLHLKIEPVWLPEVMAGAVDTFRAVLAQSGRMVSIEEPGNLPPVVADADRVGQVLINLVGNAIKYSPGGGDVVVSARRRNGTVRVSVTDHGLGISHEDQKRLFTKFYRVDSAMTRNIGGTGLGLSICKSIIELLGGTVGVKSKPGEGSTFWFELPVAPPEMVRVPWVLGPDNQAATVLVIDRDEEIASLIETYLSRRGYGVHKAHAADAALAAAIRYRPDLITLDVILDEGDGFELLQQLKEHPETAGIPVVVLSIVCDEGRSCRIGAAGYLEKPIQQERLLSLVSGLVVDGSSPLALVVDDERDIVRLLTDTLRQRGFAVAAAHDGIEALAAIERRKPDVILLDLRMPRMDGYEVVKRVKSRPELGDVPIIVMSAYPIDASRIDLLDLTDGRISKTISPEEIAERLAQTLSDRVADDKGPHSEQEGIAS